MTVARVGDGCARAPEVAVQDKHGRGNGPAVEDFAVAANALVGE